MHTKIYIKYMYQTFWTPLIKLYYFIILNHSPTKAPFLHFTLNFAQKKHIWHSFYLQIVMPLDPVWAWTEPRTQLLAAKVYRTVYNSSHTANDLKRYIFFPGLNYSRHQVLQYHIPSHLKLMDHLMSWSAVAKTTALYK